MLATVLLLIQAHQAVRAALVMIEQLAGLAYVAMVVSRLVGLLVVRQPEKS